VISFLLRVQFSLLIAQSLKWMNWYCKSGFFPQKKNKQTNQVPLSQKEEDEANQKPSFSLSGVSSDQWHRQKRTRQPR
jgi:hypothetical protein